jgi:tRNA(fMet)-specific endonuclease VapC
MVCLETDFLIALIRKDKEALKNLGTLLAEDERITTTPINASELFKGAYLSERIDDNLKAVRGILNRLELLDFTLGAAAYYGEIYSELKERGELIGDLDILVASIALANNEKLITRNIKHYNRIRELEIESW